MKGEGHWDEGWPGGLAQQGPPAKALAGPSRGGRGGWCRPPQCRRRGCRCPGQGRSSSWARGWRQRLLEVQGPTAECLFKGLRGGGQRWGLPSACDLRALTCRCRRDVTAQHQPAASCKAPAVLRQEDPAAPRQSGGHCPCVPAQDLRACFLSPLLGGLWAPGGENARFYFPRPQSRARHVAGAQRTRRLQGPFLTGC